MMVQFSAMARELYLDLLIRCLANTIYKDRSRAPWRAPEYDDTIRRQGGDWPELAHTMIGVDRLRTLRMLTEQVLVNEVPGDLIETGVWRGGACILMRGVLRVWGDTERRVYVADSFEGLPPPNCEQDEGLKVHEEKFLAVSQECVSANFDAYGLLDEQVVFVKGWFSDTLPALRAKRFALIRLDGDMYESTRDAICALYPRLSLGGYLIIDDYHSWPQCRRAIDEYRETHGVEAPMTEDAGGSVYWRKDVAELSANC